MTLHTAAGARKYLTESERAAFLQEAEVAERQVRTLCMTLAHTGCRPSEALALTADRVDLSAGVVVFESLKKRTDGVFRAALPPALLDTLDMVHGIRETQARRGRGRDVFLWPWSRMTGWRMVHAVMQAAGLDGVHACPQRVAPRLWGGRRLRRHPPQPRAKMAWACTALHNRHLCRCRRSRRKKYRQQNVGVRPAGPARSGECTLTAVIGLAPPIFCEPLNAYIAVIALVVATGV
jgi:integrase